MTNFTESMAAHVLTYEESSTRFEDFCVELLRDAERIEYVRTSRTWDHGRDGRDASAKSGPVPPLLCSSLRDDTLAKAVEDLKRLLGQPEPTVLYVCCALPVSEHLTIEIEGVTRKMCPTIETVRVFGQAQLTQLARRYPRAMDMLYAGELAELRGVYGGYAPVQEQELTGLRIALTTQLHDAAQDRRRDLLHVLILSALESQTPLTDGAIAALVSQSLHLPRPISVAFLDAELTSLVEYGLIARDANGYEITSAGLKEIANRHSAADQKLSNGQTEIRALIEELTGLPLTNAEWRPIWNILQDGLSAMFLAQGASVVQTIASVHSDSQTDVEQDDIKIHIDGITNRIRGLQGGGGRLQDVAQAVSDMLQERSSQAFEWLSSLCVVYVDMCCLGLEPNAQQQIIQEVAHFDLLLDTDVVLSLLSEGEDNHDSAKRIVTGWRDIGGKVFVAIPVLEEAAHHAWISEVDYDNVWRQLPGMSEHDAQHVIENVFVRGFRKEAGGRYGKKRWQAYIHAFRGESDHDYDKILGLLSDFDIKLLPSATQDEALALKIEQQLFQMRKSGVSNDVRNIRALQEKCNRDGRLAALLVGQRHRLTAQNRTLVVVSTSGALRQAISLCMDQIRGGEPVMYIGAIAWLLSLVPGVNLSVGVLRGVMFDMGFREHMSSFDLTVMRAVQASQQYEMHWSRRNTLQRAVRNHIERIATSRGQAPRVIRQEIMSETDVGRQTLAEAVAEAMDETALSLSEHRVAELQSRVLELEHALSEARARGNSK